MLGALVVLVVGLRLIGWLKKWLQISPKLDKLDSGLRSFLISFSGIVLYAVLFITIAMVLGVPATSSMDETLSTAWGLAICGTSVLASISMVWQ